MRRRDGAFWFWSGHLAGCELPSIVSLTLGLSSRSHHLLRYMTFKASESLPFEPAASCPYAAADYRCCCCRLIAAALLLLL